MFNGATRSGIFRLASADDSTGDCNLVPRRSRAPSLDFFHVSLDVNFHVLPTFIIMFVYFIYFIALYLLTHSGYLYFDVVGLG